MVKRCTMCYHCGVESDENVFKYFNNGKRNQPRYQCSNCQKLFTIASHGRPQGRTYAKQRNVDPPELKGLPRDCRCCGMANNAPFKYYNNKNFSQPRFKCLSCGQQFQMRVEGVGDQRRLVHTSPPSNHKLGRAPSSTDAPSSPDASNSENKTCTLAILDPWMPILEEVENFPPLSDEDSHYLDLIEAGLEDESKAPPPEAVLRLQLWASKLPRSCRQTTKTMPLNDIHGPVAV